MPRLTEHERNNCVRLLNEGLPERDVARIYNVSNGTINYLRQHFRATGNVAYLHRGGRVARSTDFSVDLLISPFIY